MGLVFPCNGVRDWYKPSRELKVVIGDPLLYDNISNNTQVSLQMGKIFDCPLAGITIIDNDRIWCKSIHCPGLSIWTEHPRRFTYANYLLLTGKHEVLVVEDALKDAR